MPTPFGVNYLLSFLITFYLFGEFLEQESKSGCSSYMSFTKYLSLSHRHEGLMFDNNYIYNLSFYPILDLNALDVLEIINILCDHYHLLSHCGTAYQQVKLTRGRTS